MGHAQLTASMDVQTLQVLVAKQLQIIARHERTITGLDANIAVLNAEIGGDCAAAPGAVRRPLGEDGPGAARLVR